MSCVNLLLIIWKRGEVTLRPEGGLKLLATLVTVLVQDIIEKTTEVVTTMETIGVLEAMILDKKIETMVDLEVTFNLVPGFGVSMDGVLILAQTTLL